jgi:hypothetical protein
MGRFAGCALNSACGNVKLAPLEVRCQTLCGLLTGLAREAALIMGLAWIPPGHIIDVFNLVGRVVHIE